MKYIPHIHYEKNKVGADYIIGDLHGCLDQFVKVLEAIGFDSRVDRMFAVGDLIDRGPDSLACLRFIGEPWFFTTVGNHEDMLVSAIDEGKEYLWQSNGGGWYSELTIPEEDEVDCWVDHIKSKVPVTITLDTDQGKIGICHAEPVSSMFSDIDQETMLWGRSVVTHKDGFIMQDVVETYHEHTPLAITTKLGDNVFIDTGACFEGGHLTCIKLQEAPDEGLN